MNSRLIAAVGGILLSSAVGAAGAESTVPVPDGAILYVRYGEPGAVQIHRSVLTSEKPEPAAADSVDVDETVLRGAAPVVSGAGAGAGAVAAAPAQPVASVPSGDLTETVRRILRDELSRLDTPRAAGQPRAPSLLDLARGTPRGMSDTGDPSAWDRDPRIVTTRRSSPPPTSFAPPLPSAGAPDLLPESTSEPTTAGAVVATVVPSPEVIREQLMSEGLFRTNLILFESADDQLLPHSQEVLRVVGDVLATFPDVMVEIQGHADPRGSASANLQLSERRAAAVRAYLLQCCVLDGGRLISRGYGESRPLVSGTGATSLALNRRVEFRILNPEALRRVE